MKYTILNKRNNVFFIRLALAGFMALYLQATASGADYDQLINIISYSEKTLEKDLKGFSVSYKLKYFDRKEDESYEIKEQQQTLIFQDDNWRIKTDNVFIHNLTINETSSDNISDQAYSKGSFKRLLANITKDGNSEKFSGVVSRKNILDTTFSYYRSLYGYVDQQKLSEYLRDHKNDIVEIKADNAIIEIFCKSDNDTILYKLDSHKNYRLLMIKRETDEGVAETNFELELLGNNIWIPTLSKTSLYIKDTNGVQSSPVREIQIGPIDISSFTYGQNFSEDTFDITFPDETLVYDQDTQIRYIVGEINKSMLMNLESLNYKINPDVVKDLNNERKEIIKSATTNSENISSELLTENQKYHDEDRTELKHLQVDTNYHHNYIIYLLLLPTSVTIVYYYRKSIIKNRHGQ